jgi:hypothetical protein
MLEASAAQNLFLVVSFGEGITIPVARRLPVDVPETI